MGPPVRGTRSQSAPERTPNLSRALAGSEQYQSSLSDCQHGGCLVPSSRSPMRYDRPLDLPMPRRSPVYALFGIPSTGLREVFGQAARASGLVRDFWLRCLRALGRWGDRGVGSARHQQRHVSAARAVHHGHGADACLPRRRRRAAWADPPPIARAHRASVARREHRNAKRDRRNRRPPPAANSRAWS